MWKELGAERGKERKGLACLVGTSLRLSHVHQHHPIPPDHIITVRGLPTASSLPGNLARNDPSRACAGREKPTTRLARN